MSLLSLFKKKQPKVFAVCALQNQTEEAEGMSFTVNLFEDETPEQITAKLDKLFAIAESRRKFNNDRMQAHFKAIAEAQEAAKKQSEV